MTRCTSTVRGGPPLYQDTIAVVNPVDEQVIAHVPHGNGRGRRCGGTGRARRLPRLGRDPARRTRSPAHRAGRRAGRPQGRTGRDHHGRAGITAAAVADGPRGGARAGGRLVRRTGRPARLRGADRQLHRAAGAGRGGRRDHPLELPAPPDRRQGRPRARRGLHRRPQARRGHPAHRPALRGSHGGGRTAARRLQPGHRPRTGRGPGARRPRGRRPGLVHRLHRRGPARSAPPPGLPSSGSPWSWAASRPT